MSILTFAARLRLCGRRVFEAAEFGARRFGAARILTVGPLAPPGVEIVDAALGDTKFGSEAGNLVLIAPAEDFGLIEALRQEHKGIKNREC